MSLGEMTPLRRLCLAHRITRSQLAEKAGMSRPTLYAIEAGTITEQTVLKIAAALELEPLYVADVLAGRVEVEGQVAA